MTSRKLITVPGKAKSSQHWQQQLFSSALITDDVTFVVTSSFTTHISFTASVEMIDFDWIVDLDHFPSIGSKLCLIIVTHDGSKFFLN